VGILRCVTVSEDTSQRLIDAIAERSRAISQNLARLDDEELHRPSDLRDWSRLTIACHLRFGAQALLGMTRCALQAMPVAYYPEGRETQRPRTLEPLSGESGQDVVESLARHSEELNQEWSALGPSAWRVAVNEPQDNPDLGPVPLWRLPLLRLTEVEVHGTDLGLNLADWSEIFITTVLPMRLEWFNVRRANHRVFDDELEGSWLLVATDGPAYRVSVDGTKVESVAASPHSQATAVIETTSRDLLAILLGRAVNSPPVITGDIAFGQSFSLAFPGP
jgi:uncharacterized protein (TIGR03083 family)